MAYVALAAYQAYITALTQGTVSTYSTAESAFQQQCLDSAQVFIERTTKRHFEAVTATRIYGPASVSYANPQILILDDDLLSVTPGGLLNGNGSVIPDANYWLLPFNRSPKYGIQLKLKAFWISRLTAW